MKRTRKWGYVEQEAKRLSALGLSAAQIAKRLGVHKATIGRWMAAGKLDRRTGAPVPSHAGQTPAQWAATIRKDYSLDASDAQLVELAQRALEMAYDVSLAPHVRLQAMNGYRSTVKDLALVARRADEAAAPKPGPEPRAVEPAKRTGTDPRKLLMAVK